MDTSGFIVSPDSPINKLECKEAFQGLSDREKRYSHYLSRAGWDGGLICLLQTSPESTPIFLLLKEVFSRQSVISLRESTSELLSESEFQAFLFYVSAFFTNLGNYRSFGDTKFIPGIEQDKFKLLLTSSVFGQSEPDLLNDLWTACTEGIYSLVPRMRQLGFGEEGITTYYSGNCTRSDAELVQKFMQQKGLSPYNTRLFKIVSQTGSIEYNLRLASATTSNDPVDQLDNVAHLLGSYTYEGTTITISRGDYAPLMKRMCDNLEKAKYFASDLEQSMLNHYIRSFTTGSIEDHKAGSRDWIKNKGPTVETYIGFIESYRDPYGVRGEYECFVALVNKAMSAKFSTLVESSEPLVAKLPWPRSFEKDLFLRPDFTSLDVLTYASSGIPSGINIPNYDDIRQNEGFKNVSLGNVISSAGQDKRVTFLLPEDRDLFIQLKGPSFDVQVALHELLGHGTGKLFQEEQNGNLNFDVNSVMNPLTGTKVTSWYKPGETWDTKFSSLASPYEECRAECVGLYLCLSQDVLRIFGHEGADASNIIYVNWLNMVRAGVVALEFYSPENKKWGQAHMHARYVILRVLLENGRGVVSVEKTSGPDGDDIVVRLDKTKIESYGKAAIGDFLQKLQVFKSTADEVQGRALFLHYSEVEEDWLSLRKIVLARKLPRRMIVQPLTTIEDDGVTLKEFEATPDGIIQFFCQCYPGYDHALEALWKKDRQFW